MLKLYSTSRVELVNEFNSSEGIIEFMITELLPKSDIPEVKYSIIRFLAVMTMQINTTYNVIKAVAKLNILLQLHSIIENSFELVFSTTEPLLYINIIDMSLAIVQNVVSIYTMSISQLLEGGNLQILCKILTCYIEFKEQVENPEDQKS